MDRYLVPRDREAWQAARDACDITGTSFADACGLGSGSRLRFWRIRHKLEKPERPPPFVQAMLDGGQDDEPLAAVAFRPLLWPGQLLAHCGQRRRRFEGFLFGVNPDRLVLTPYRGGYDVTNLLEIKTVQRDVGESEPIPEFPDKLVPNTLQLLLQLWCCRLEHGWLFYWHRASGAYRRFEVRMDWHAFREGPLQWALETLRAVEIPKRMDPAVKRERIQFVLDHFYVHL